jgi:hypothetical protein
MTLHKSTFSKECLLHQQDFTDCIGSYKTDLRKEQHLEESMCNFMQNGVFRDGNAEETFLAYDPFSKK